MVVVGCVRAGSGVKRRGGGSSLLAYRPSAVGVEVRHAVSIVRRRRRRRVPIPKARVLEQWVAQSNDLEWAARRSASPVVHHSLPVDDRPSDARIEGSGCHLGCSPPPKAAGAHSRSNGSPSRTISSGPRRSHARLLTGATPTRRALRALGDGAPAAQGAAEGRGFSRLPKSARTFPSPEATGVARPRARSGAKRRAVRSRLRGAFRVASLSAMADPNARGAWRWKSKTPASHQQPPRPPAPREVVPHDGGLAAAAARSGALGQLRHRRRATFTRETLGRSHLGGAPAGANRPFATSDLRHPPVDRARSFGIVSR